MKTKDIWQLEGICGTIIFESCGRSGAEKSAGKEKMKGGERRNVQHFSM
jgi:hypothetical protein